MDSFSVSAGDWSGYISWGNTTSDSLGHFELPAFPGSGQLEASASNQPSTSVPVTVTDDTSVVIHLPSSIRVTGRLLDRNGAPLTTGSMSSISVCLRPESPEAGVMPSSSCVGTDAASNYGLGVVPGKYSVSVSGNLYEYLQDSANKLEAGAEAGSSPDISSYAYFSLSRAGTVSVSAATEIDLTLPTRRITGQVFDSRGIAAVGASVAYASMSSFTVTAGDWSSYVNWGNTTSDSLGRFELPAFPGSGQLEASAPNQPSTSVPVTVTEDASVEIHERVERPSNLRDRPLAAPLPRESSCG